MKRISALLFALLAFSMNACERHSAEETRAALEAEEAESGGKPAVDAPSTGSDITPAAEVKPAPAPDTQSASAVSKPGEADPAKAPKFIPDSK